MAYIRQNFVDLVTVLRAAHLQNIENAIIDNETNKLNKLTVGNFITGNLPKINSSGELEDSGLSIFVDGNGILNITY